MVGKRFTNSKLGFSLSIKSVVAIRERALEAKYASIAEDAFAGFKLMLAGVKTVRSVVGGAGPNIHAKETNVTAEEVMTTLLIEGVRWAALRTASVVFTAGEMMSRS